MMSDVHANPSALEAALADARALGCDKLIFLGDVTGYGYDPRLALKLVRENFDVVLMGNHDAVSTGLCSTLETFLNPNYDLDRAAQDMLFPDDLDWLRARDHLFATRSFACTHGDFTHPSKFLYILSGLNAAQNLLSRTEKLLFCAHTHHAAIWELRADGYVRPKLDRLFRRPLPKADSVVLPLAPKSRYIVNVGSVGYPRNDLCCTYAIYDNRAKTVTIRRLPFNFRAYVRELAAHKIDLPAWLSE